MKTFQELKDFVISSLEGIDKEMIPWLNRFNELPNIITMESCQGHNTEDDKPYLWLIININKKLYLGNDKYNFEEVFTPMGKYGYVHMYGFYFEQKTWQKNIKEVYYRCMKITRAYSLSDQTTSF